MKDGIQARWPDTNTGRNCSPFLVSRYVGIEDCSLVLILKVRCLTNWLAEILMKRPNKLE